MSDESAKKSGVNRRNLLKAAGAAACGAAFVKAVSPLAAYSGQTSKEEFLQQHYKELSEADKKKIFARIKRKTKREYGAEVTVRDPQPQPKTHFAYALNLTNCLGCRQCAEACHRENNHDRKTHNSYIRVFEMQQGSMDLAKATSRYQHAVPQDDKFYMPIQCHHCENTSTPCLKTTSSTCPSNATTAKSRLASTSAR